MGAPELDEGEAFDAASMRLSAQLNDEVARLEQRLSLRRLGADQIAKIQTAFTRRVEVEGQIESDLASWTRAHQALERAQALRDQGNAIRNSVDLVRSAIIRREFNDRLNRVWRDLFVRLAPAEPFVPAFRIPESST